jgi:hypothetical protein
MAPELRTHDLPFVIWFGESARRTLREADDAS